MPEQLIVRLREVDVLVGHGSTAIEACRQIGIGEEALYRWHKGMWRHEGRSAAAREGAGARKRAIEEAGG